MINKQTIISAYDEKLTLLQWLKLVNKALDEAVLTNVEINQRGNATFVFVFLSVKNQIPTETITMIIGMVFTYYFNKKEDDHNGSI